LIVNDNKFNLFVLNSYLRSINVAPDEVKFILYILGFQWDRSDRQDIG